MKMRKFKAGCAVIAFWVLFAAVPVLAAENKEGADCRSDHRRRTYD